MWRTHRMIRDTDKANEFIESINDQLDEHWQRPELRNEKIIETEGFLNRNRIRIQTIIDAMDNNVNSVRYYLSNEQRDLRHKLLPSSMVEKIMHYISYFKHRLIKKEFDDSAPIEDTNKFMNICTAINAHIHILQEGRDTIQIDEVHLATQELCLKSVELALREYEYKLSTNDIPNGVMRLFRDFHEMIDGDTSVQRIVITYNYRMDKMDIFVPKVRASLPKNSLIIEYSGLSWILNSIGDIIPNVLSSTMKGIVIISSHCHSDNDIKEYLHFNNCVTRIRKEDFHAKTEHLLNENNSKIDEDTQRYFDRYYRAYPDEIYDRFLQRFADKRNQAKGDRKAVKATIETAENTISVTASLPLSESTGETKQIKLKTTENTMAGHGTDSLDDSKWAHAKQSIIGLEDGDFSKVNIDSASQHNIADLTDNQIGFKNSTPFAREYLKIKISHKTDGSDVGSPLCKDNDNDGSNEDEKDDYKEALPKKENVISTAIKTAENAIYETGSFHLSKEPTIGSQLLKRSQRIIETTHNSDNNGKTTKSKLDPSASVFVVSKRDDYKTEAETDEHICCHRSNITYRTQTTPLKLRPLRELFEDEDDDKKTDECNDVCDNEDISPVCDIEKDECISPENDDDRNFLNKYGMNLLGCREKNDMNTSMKCDMTKGSHGHGIAYFSPKQIKQIWKKLSKSDKLRFPSYGELYNYLRYTVKVHFIDEQALKCELDDGKSEIYIFDTDLYIVKNGDTFKIYGVLIPNDFDPKNAKNWKLKLFDFLFWKLPGSSFPR